MSEAKPDVPPPRYEQVGGWKHLICDEQEWLARPAPWGIDKLPEEVRGRKQNLYNAYYLGWLATFITCPECRPQVQRLFTDSGLYFDDAALAGWDVETHEADPCDAAPLRRNVRNERRGLITHTELINRLWDDLHQLFHTASRSAKQAGEPIPQARLLDTGKLALELIGPNPFRPVFFPTEWRTETALILARQMYGSRDFGAMPILADALQDAGCEDEAILSHCRDPQATHVRGCWVVDLVLGKQ